MTTAPDAREQESIKTKQEQEKLRGEGFKSEELNLNLFLHEETYFLTG